MSSPSAAGSTRAGKVRLFGLVGATWTQVGFDIPNSVQGAFVGLALAADGGTVAVGFVAGTPKVVRAYSIAP